MSERAGGDGGNLEFASTKGGELWLRWGDRWLLLTSERRPGDFLAPSTLQTYYGADVAKALGVYDNAHLSRQARAFLQEAGQELGDQATAIAGQSLELQDLGEAASAASDAIQTMETAFTNTDLTGEDLPYPVHEIRGLSKTLQMFQGELTNNLAKLMEIGERGRWWINKSLRSSRSWMRPMRGGMSMMRWGAESPNACAS